VEPGTGSPPSDHRSEQRADDEQTGSRQIGEPAPDSEADRPEDVPRKATITIKEINDNRYYYWQWRDGDTVKSKYRGPVDPATD
jgi:Ni/Co efflux regulator RcnB